MKIIKKQNKGFTLLELLAVLIVMAIIAVGIYELYNNAKKNYIVSSDFDNISGIMDKIIDAEGGSLQPGTGACSAGCGFNDFGASLGSSSYNPNIFNPGLVPSDMTDGKVINNSLKSPVYFYASTGTDLQGNTYPILIGSTSGYDSKTCIDLVQKFKDKYYQNGSGLIFINGTKYTTLNLTTSASTPNGSAAIITACGTATAPITIQVWYNRTLSNS